MQQNKTAKKNSNFIMALKDTTEFVYTVIFKDCEASERSACRYLLLGANHFTFFGGGRGGGR